MIYTVSDFTTQAECQLRIDTALAESRVLIFRKATLERQAEVAAMSTQDLERDLNNILVDIAALKSAEAIMAPGKLKDEMKDRIKKAEYQKYLLEHRSDLKVPGQVSLTEYKLACAERLLLENEAYILALTNRKTELP